MSSFVQTIGNIIPMGYEYIIHSKYFYFKSQCGKKLHNSFKSLNLKSVDKEKVFKMLLRLLFYVVSH